MVIKHLRYYRYDTEDIIKQCPKCGGDLVNDSTLINALTLDVAEYQNFIVGKWKIGYCPDCNYVEFIRG